MTKCDSCASPPPRAKRLMQDPEHLQSVQRGVIEVAADVSEATSCLDDDDDAIIVEDADDSNTSPVYISALSFHYILPS